MKLDPGSIKTMTLAEFHAFAEGFRMRSGESDVEAISDADFYKAVAREEAR